jgi:DNA-binding protein YbaB
MEKVSKMETGLVRVSVSCDGKIIISIGSENCNLSEGQVNMLIEKLIAAKEDAKDFKEASRKMNSITKKYNGNGISIDIPVGSNVVKKILLEDQKF